MTAKEILEKVKNDSSIELYIQTIIRRHQQLVSSYPSGEKAYYMNERYKIVKKMEQNLFFTTWINSGYENIFAGEGVQSVLSWIDMEIQEYVDELKQEVQEVGISISDEKLEEKRKRKEERFSTIISNFFFHYGVYKWLDSQLKELTDDHEKYFASKRALHEYNKIEYQLIEHGFYDTKQGWLKNIVTLQALIKRLYRYRYFNVNCTGKSSNPYKGIYSFIETHFKIPPRQNFEKKRMSRIDESYYISSIEITPL